MIQTMCEGIILVVLRLGIIFIVLTINSLSDCGIAHDCIKMSS